MASFAFVILGISCLQSGESAYSNLIIAGLILGLVGDVHLNLHFVLKAILVSDVVFIFNTFGGSEKFSMRITNLSFYYVGQILIALSLK